MNKKVVSTKLENVYNEMNKIYDVFGFKYTRNTTEYLRKRSADVFIMGKKPDALVVAEKVAASYMDKELNTYAFELKSLKDEELQGWLFNKEMLNTHYCLIYPKSKSNDTRYIDSIEAYIINREKLQNYVVKALKRKKLNLEQLLPELMRIGREYPDQDKIFINLTNDARIVWSRNKLPEKPINCVISKAKLREFADIVIKKDMIEEDINVHFKLNTDFSFSL